MDEQTQLLTEALKQFGLWSNYMLVTTVAALAWVATADRVSLSTAALRWVVGSFSLSIAFAIFTLALVPIVAQSLAGATSIYDVRAGFKLFWLWGPTFHLKLKAVCWPQHVSFLVGILVFAYSSTRSVRRENGTEVQETR